MTKHDIVKIVELRKKFLELELKRFIIDNKHNWMIINNVMLKARIQELERLLKVIKE